MIVLVIMCGALLIALARHGKFSNLSTVRFRAPVFIFLGFAIQLVIFQEFWQQNSETRPLTPVAYLVSLSLLLAALALNHRVAGTKLLLAGFLLNAFAIVSNGGYMPVSPQARAISGKSPIAPGEIKNNVIGIDSGTPLAYLGYVFPIPFRASFSSYQISNPRAQQSQPLGNPPVAPGENKINEIGMDSGTKLVFLGDIFPIPKGLPFSNVFSVGDLVIAIGAAYLIYTGMITSQPQRL